MKSKLAVFDFDLTIRDDYPDHNWQMGVVTYPSMSGASLSKFLTAAILASGVDGGPSVDIGKPMAIHKTTTRMKMDNKHQCCRRKWTPKAKKLSLRRE